MSISINSSFTEYEQNSLIMVAPYEHTIKAEVIVLSKNTGKAFL